MSLTTTHYQTHTVLFATKGKDLVAILDKASNTLHTFKGAEAHVSKIDNGEHDNIINHDDWHGVVKASMPNWDIVQFTYDDCQEFPITLRMQDGFTNLLPHYSERPLSLIQSILAETKRDIMQQWRQLITNFSLNASFNFEDAEEVKMRNRLMLGMRLACMTADGELINELNKLEGDLGALFTDECMRGLGARYIQLLYGLPGREDVDYTTMPVESATLERMAKLDAWVKENISDTVSA